MTFKDENPLTIKLLQVIISYFHNNYDASKGHFLNEDTAHLPSYIEMCIDYP